MIYARISQDSRGDGLALARQEHDCRRVADTLGLKVRAVYADDDSSAYSGKRRPQYERLLGDIRSGRVDVVLAWHADRIYRRQQDLVEFIDAVQHAGAHVATVSTGLLDLSTASGRLMARVVGAVAQHESELKGERVRAKHAELRRCGSWNGSRTFGYRNAGGGILIVDPAQAEVLREIADRLLRGESAYAICRDLTERGVPTTRGGVWRTRTVWGVVTKPAAFGYRTWDWTTEDGYQGVWEPILDRSTVKRLVLLRDNPAPRRPTLPRVALMTGGLFRCGRCGHPLYAFNVSSTRPRAYVCRRPPTGRGCGRLWISAIPAEAVVRNVTLSTLANLSFKDFGSVDNGPPLEELVQDEARLRCLAAAYATGRLTAEEWRPVRSLLVDRIDSARHEVLNAHSAAALDGLPSELAALELAWAEWSLDRRRDVVAAVIDHVDVRAARRLGRGFDDWRILDGVVWTPLIGAQELNRHCPPEPNGRSV